MVPRTEHSKGQVSPEGLVQWSLVQAIRAKPCAVKVTPGSPGASESTARAKEEKLAWGSKRGDFGEQN